jgi:hypothetical protein
MKYVYLVYEDCHGLIGVYETQENATKRVKQDVLESCPELLNQPVDYNSQWCWGWEGASYWKRYEVL